MYDVLTLAGVGACCVGDGGVLHIREYWDARYDATDRYDHGP
jgi:hypothetical protein